MRVKPYPATGKKKARRDKARKRIPYCATRSITLDAEGSHSFSIRIFEIFSQISNACSGLICFALIAVARMFWNSYRHKTGTIHTGSLCSTCSALDVRELVRFSAVTMFESTTIIDDLRA